MRMWGYVDAGCPKNYQAPPSAGREPDRKKFLLGMELMEFVLVPISSPMAEFCGGYRGHDSANSVVGTSDVLQAT